MISRCAGGSLSSCDRSMTLEISFLNRSMFAEPATMDDGPPPRPELDRPNDGRLPDYVIDLED